jgi:hypothetical protein
MAVRTKITAALAALLESIAGQTISGKPAR